MPNPSPDTPPAVARPTTAADPAALIGQARDGSADALGTLLASYVPYLTLLARLQIGRRIQGKVDPGDVVQDACLDAHRQIKGFRGTSEPEFLGWLRVILSGRIAMVLRHYLGTKGRDANLEREISAGVDESNAALGGGLAANGSTPSQHVSKREQAVILAEALERLPADYRDVIVLRQIEGLGFADVAARMKRSEDSVQKLWVRGLAALRREIGGEA